MRVCVFGTRLAAELSLTLSLCLLKVRPKPWLKAAANPSTKGVRSPFPVRTWKMPRARGWPIRKPSDSSVELAQQFSPPSFLPNLPTYLRRRRRRKMKKAPNKGPYTHSKLLIKFPTASRHDPQPINALLQQILRTFRSGDPINLLTHRIDHRITLASSPPSLSAHNYIGPLICCVVIGKLICWNSEPPNFKSRSKHYTTQQRTKDRRRNPNSWAAGLLLTEAIADDGRWYKYQI